MQKDVLVELSTWVGLGTILFCAVTAGYSYHAYNSSQDIQKAHQQSLDTLHQEVARLEAKLTELGHALAAAQAQPRCTISRLAASGPGTNGANIGFNRLGAIGGKRECRSEHPPANV